jgi:hypothetical protein
MIIKKKKKFANLSFSKVYYMLQTRVVLHIVVVRLETQSFIHKNKRRKKRHAKLAFKKKKWAALCNSHVNIIGSIS